MGWQRFVRRRWWDRERAHEIESYLEIEAAENIARGMTPAEAAAAARRKFGNPILVREEIYRMNTVGWIEGIWQDLRYGARLLRLNPGFAVVAVASLALGIGANTAIFQLVDAVRLRSLPIQNPQELAEVKIVGGNGGMGLNPGRYGGLTRPLWHEIRRNQQAFSGIFAWAAGEVRVGEGSELRRANSIWVSGDFFRVLGVQPAWGRLFLPEDEGAACPFTRAVISHSYWQSQLGGRPLDGSKLVINGELTDVIGITPPGFFGLAVGERFDIALPFCQPRELRRDVFDVAVMGRLRPGWTIERASAHLSALSGGVFEATAPTGYGARTIERFKKFRLAAYPASGGVSSLRSAYESSLSLLLAITGLVLLIACTNLANLMLARASTREREIAVRLALGASRGRLLRQLVAESALLATAGAALGVGLAQILSQVLVTALSTESSSVHLAIETDWRVLLFAASVAALTCVIFGAAPALRASRISPEAAMRATARSVTAGRERFSIQRLIVVTQIAVSLVLLVGALLFVRSFYNLTTFDAGVRQSGITVAFLGFQKLNLPLERLAPFQRELLDEVRSIPGILNAATTSMMPLLGGAWSHGIRIGSADGGAMFTWVSPGYFETMGIPIVAGRNFTRDDTQTSPRVAVVNQTFVRNYLEGAEPLGKTMVTSPEPNYPATVYEIVGVIPDTRYNSLRSETPPMVFAPASQHPSKGPWAAMLIHSSVPPSSAIATVKSALAQKHPEMVMEFSVFQNRIHDGLVRERLMAMLSGFFGFLAALLAMVGLYGVISYIVTRRRNEIGIRIALGAGRGQVVGMVMREAGRLVVIGVVIGTGLALIAGRSARSLLFGLQPYDPATLISACLLLAAIAAGASFLPARRVARLDPMAALRHD